MPDRAPNKNRVRELPGQLSLNFDIDPLALLSVDEIFERADESLLNKLREDKRIERKPCKFGGDSLGEYFSMWANTAPEGGLIAVGQLNAGGFEGCDSLSSEQLNQREKTGYVFCPDAKYDLKRIPVMNQDGKQDFVLLFRVKYSPDIVVRTSSRKAFVRKGDSKVELDADEIRELQADKGEVSFEQQDSNLKWPEDFSESEVAKFVGAVRKARGLSETLTTEEVLTLRHLGVMRKGQFHPNIACALLFAKDPLRLLPGCKIRFQRFEGEEEKTGDKYNAVKDLVLEGTVPDLIHQVESSLDSQLRTFSPLDATVKFFPLPEYPKLAWYEAVVNACVHRSYGNGMKNVPIFVKMFDDKLVIESPGPFPPFVTPDNIYESHHPRNPWLMDAMFYLEYVKCAHEGTRRIRDTMADMKLPAPEFKQDEKGAAVVRVILRNNVKQRRAWVDRDVSKLISEALAVDLSEEEIRALNLAAENGSITVSDAHKVLDVSWQRARKLLFGLARKRVFQYIRFREFKKDIRDPKAHFRLRSHEPLPEGAFEQRDLDAAENDESEESQ